MSLGLLEKRVNISGPNFMCPEVLFRVVSSKLNKIIIYDLGSKAFIIKQIHGGIYMNKQNI